MDKQPKTRKETEMAAHFSELN